MKLTFLAPLHQTPPRWVASLADLFFAARACDSKVSLLAGYETQILVSVTCTTRDCEQWEKTEYHVFVAIAVPCHICI